MLFTILGVQVVDFKDKSGEQVNGCKFYLSCENSRVIGSETLSVFVKDENLHPVFEVKNLSDLIGLEVDGQYNRYGRITELSPVA